eukprot:6131173-Alexandrium_andersonii.AAC.1
MSASLVGSEMCIRDRAKMVYNCCLKAPDSAQNRLKLSRTASCNLLLDSCLLYTSDAADDM